MHQATSAPPGCGLLECSPTVITLYSVYYIDPALSKPEFSPLGPPINYKIVKCPLADRRSWVKEGFLQPCWHHISLCRARLKPLLFPCQKCKISYLLIFSSACPSQLLISLQVPALPPLSFSSGHCHGAVVSPCVTNLWVSLSLVPFILSWSSLSVCWRSCLQQGIRVVLFMSQTRDSSV